MKLGHLTMALALIVSGCFSPSPGGIQGAWQFSQTFELPTSSVTESIEYVINGNQITRILEQDIRSKQSNNRIVLLSEQNGEFNVSAGITDSGTTQMSITNLQEVEYPNASAFAIAGAILGNSAADQETFFGEKMGLTFRSKALYTRSGNTLRIKFSSVSFPATLTPPFIELEKRFRLFP